MRGTIPIAIHCSIVFGYLKINFLDAVRSGFLSYAFLGTVGIGFLGIVLMRVTLYDPQIEIALAAYGIRLFLVIFFVSHATNNILQEISYQWLDLLRANGLSSLKYLLCKLLNYLMLALLINISVFLLGWMFVDNVPGLLFWTLSLCMELLIVVSAAIFFSFGFASLPIALSATLFGYLFARVAYIIPSNASITELLSLTEIIEFLFHIIKIVFPNLAIFTQSKWMIEGAPAVSILGWLMLQTIIIIGLLITITLWDISHKNN